MIAVIVGTNVGINSLVSRRLGERRQAEANDAAAHGIVIAIFSWAVIALLGFFGSHAFFSMSTSNQTIIDMGVSYTTIVTVFCIFSSVQVCVCLLYTSLPAADKKHLDNGFVGSLCKGDDIPVIHL